MALAVLLFCSASIVFSLAVCLSRIRLTVSCFLNFFKAFVGRSHAEFGLSGFPRLSCLVGTRDCFADTPGVGQCRLFRNSGKIYYCFRCSRFQFVRDVAVTAGILAAFHCFAPFQRFSVYPVWGCGFAPFADQVDAIR